MLGLTIFCSLLFSLVAFPGILYASKANTQFALGNVEEAMRLNKKASIWCWISAVAVPLVLMLQFSGVLNLDLNAHPGTKKTLNEKIVQTRGDAV